MSPKARKHGDPRPFELPDGRWCVFLELEREGGKRRRDKITAPTEAECRAKLRAAQRERERGRAPAADRLTVARVLTDWIESSVRPRLDEDTYRSYEAIVRLHLVPEIGRLALVKLRPRDVDAMLARKAQPVKDGDGNERRLSARRLQLIHATLRAALSWAVNEELVDRNVAKLVAGPTVRRREVEPLSEADARRLLLAVRGERLEALYVLALAVGLREGELLGLRWRDLDLEAGTLRTVQQAQRVTGEGIGFEDLKTDRSRRSLALPAVAVAALRRRRELQAGERERAGESWRGYDLVFTTSIGTAIDARNLRREWAALLERAGLPQRRFYDSRHTAASHLLAAGVDLRTVMEILGHSQIGLTANTYTHVVDRLKREAAEKMDRLLRGEGEPERRRRRRRV